MTDTPHPPATVSTHATATVRLRPAVLVMVARGRAAAATLELGLAEVKRWAADAGRRLTRLGAARVAVGEPHPDDCADPDPMAGIRREARTRLPRTPDAPPADRPGVNVTLTATWDIAGSSAEEVLLLVDRLRFDAAVDAEPPAAPPAPPPGAGPEEQLRAMVAQWPNWRCRRTTCRPNSCTSPGRTTTYSAGRRPRRTPPRAGWPSGWPTRPADGSAGCTRSRPDLRRTDGRTG
ncbi:MAG: hypothetical protein U0871_21350 [Gemmataceae bacterium]